MPYHVLVGDREQVTLLVAQLQALLRHGLHGSRHVVVALSLLCQLGFLHQVVLIHFLGYRGRTKGKKRQKEFVFGLEQGGSPYTSWNRQKKKEDRGNE